MQKGNQKFYCFQLLLILLGVITFIMTAQPCTASAKTIEKASYLIKVNRSYNTVTVYSKDEDGKYTVPVKAMPCSVGTFNRTTTGTFKTKQKYRWKILMGGVWGQYSTRIVDGILFHSVYYYDKNPAALATREYNKLGTSASHGCIRLSVGDAKWIYDNCSIGTTVVIYDDKKSPGPLGKPEGIKIASNVRWDPTDPDKKNPFRVKQPEIKGVKNLKIDWGDKINLLKGVKAISSVGVDISSKLAVRGKVDTLKPGKYTITYSIKDDLKRTAEKVITITVNKNKKAPVFEGVNDKVIRLDSELDTKFALTGVKASCKGIKLNKDLIKVKIVKSSDTEYQITYKASIGSGPVATKKTTVIIDNEPPQISGLTELTLNEGDIVDNDFVMSKLTITDNYTKTDDIKVTIWITENADGKYVITCEAQDQVQNMKVMQTTVEKPKAEDPAEEQSTQDQQTNEQSNEVQPTVTPQNN